MSAGYGEGALIAERYRLERVLGSGGMASVWLARDERLRRPVAVKLLSDTLAHDESYLSRFRREARLAARAGTGEDVGASGADDRRGLSAAQRAAASAATTTAQYRERRFGMAKVQLTIEGGVVEEELHGPREPIPT